MSTRGAEGEMTDPHWSETLLEILRMNGVRDPRHALESMLYGLTLRQEDSGEGWRSVTTHYLEWEKPNTV